MSVDHKFIKELLSVQPKKQFERFFKFGAKVRKTFLHGILAGSILEKSLRVSRSSRRNHKIEMKMEKPMERKINDIVFLLLLKRIMWLLDNHKVLNSGESIFKVSGDSSYRLTGNENTISRKKSFTETLNP